MTTKLDEVVALRLQNVLAEMNLQSNLAPAYWDDRASFDEEMAQICEFIEDAREYSVAYDVIVANLEHVPFTLTGSAAVGLLEVGVVRGYKSEDAKDAIFDRRIT